MGIGSTSRRPTTPFNHHPPQVAPGTTHASLTFYFMSNQNAKDDELRMLKHLLNRGGSSHKSPHTYTFPESGDSTNHRRSRKAWQLSRHGDGREECRMNRRVLVNFQGPSACVITMTQPRRPLIAPRRHYDLAYSCSALIFSCFFLAVKCFAKACNTARRAEIRRHNG